MAPKKTFKTAHPDPTIRELEKIRKRRDESVVDFAPHVGVAPSTYEKWLFGNRRTANPKAVLALARSL